MNTARDATHPKSKWPDLTSRNSAHARVAAVVSRATALALGLERGEALDEESARANHLGTSIAPNVVPSEKERRVGQSSLPVFDSFETRIVRPEAHASDRTELLALIRREHLTRVCFRNAKFQPLNHWSL